MVGMVVRRLELPDSSSSRTLYLDAAIGLIGNINHIQDTDASDNDIGYMKYASNLYFWYQMPTAGLLEVWIEAQCRGLHHRVSLFDEWGWSDSSVNQHNYLTLNASSWRVLQRIADGRNLVVYRKRKYGGLLG